MGNNVDSRKSEVGSRIRLQKVIADSGLCSRRNAEDLIREGRVFVNDCKATIGMSVSEDDKILVNGKPLQGQRKKILIALNKPEGYTCTNRRFRGERNVFDLVDSDERLFVIGRLDKQSRGLVLLTNDGELAQQLAHPRYEHEKVYEVTVSPIDDQPSLKIIKTFKQGIISEGERLQAKDAEYLGKGRYRITLAQGRKRQIRRMFGYFELRVTDLVRTQIGKYKLGNLKEGMFERV